VSAPGMSLDRKLVWEQEEPILDLAFPSTGMLVLSPARVALYQRAAGGWEQQAAVQLTPPRPWPRDLRGRLHLEGSAFQVFLPGLACTGSVVPASATPGATHAPPPGATALAGAASLPANPAAIAPAPGATRPTSADSAATAPAPKRSAAARASTPGRALASAPSPSGTASLSVPPSPSAPASATAAAAATPTTSAPASTPARAVASASSPAALAMECHPANAPWPLGGAGAAQIAATFAAARNHFDGSVIDASGQTHTVPPFFSAASIEERGRTLWLLAALDGRTRWFDADFKPACTDARTPCAEGIAGWGSDIASTGARCGNGRLVLATRAGDADAPDALEAFAIVNRAPEALAPPAAFGGPITALWPLDGGASALAVVKDLASGRYRAYVVTVDCGS
jgi:hypothetical protein